MNQSQSPIIFRLTALWALCESGIGGWMHALHLPFTGFFVGAFAIIIISLIAFYSKNSFRQIIQATILVILIKAAVSPQSPPPAYVAVAFQGFIGAVFFSLFSFRFSCVLLGIISMAESALQKIIIATIVFGKSLWEAIDSFFNSIVKEFHLSTDVSFSFWIIGIYVGVYALWGLVLGLWMMKLPTLIEEKVTNIKSEISFMNPVNSTETAKPKPKRFIKLIVALMLLAFIAAAFLFDHNLNRATYIVLRTLGVIALLVLVINPLFKWVMQRWVSKQKKEARFSALINYLPKLRAHILPAYQLAAKQQNIFARFKAFTINLIVLTIYPIDEKQ